MMLDVLIFPNTYHEKGHAKSIPLAFRGLIKIWLLVDLTVGRENGGISFA